MSDTFLAPSVAPPSAGALMQSLGAPPPPPPPANPLTETDGRMAYRDPQTASPTSASPHVQALLGAPSTLDLMRALANHDDRQAVAAGAVVGRVAQQIATNDPSETDTTGNRGAQWNLAAAHHAVTSGVMADPRFRQLYRSFLTNPSGLTPEDGTELATKLANYGETSRHFVTPDSPSSDFELGKVTFAGDNAAVSFVPKDGAPVGDVVANTSIPVLPLAAASTDKLAFVRTTDATAVVGPPTAESDQIARVMYPALPTGTGHQWAPRRPIDIADIPAFTSRFWGTGDLPAAEVEIIHGLADQHVAAKPGNYLLVRTPSQHEVRQVKKFFDEQGITELANYPAAEVQRPNGEDVTATSAPAVAGKLPAKVTQTEINHFVDGVLGAGGTAPILYLHQALNGAYTPVREHHYVGPAGQAVIVRTRDSGTDTPHGYTAWMHPGDAGKLSASPQDVNQSTPKPTGEDPVRQEDGSYLVNNEVRLHFEHNLTPEVRKAQLTGTVWDSTVAGKATRAFVLDTPAADVPNLSVGTDATTAKAGLPTAGPRAISGIVHADGHLVAVVAPATNGQLDLGVLADGLSTLRRLGVVYNPNKVTITGSDGQTYQPNGEARR